ncbi:MULTISPECIES: hypothetical protein [Nitrosomonas]|uniref:Uncharacterized protein n=1 Tax=Nitrosomonas communis TaxID=44574 RepID=A0A0F7KDN0_9PROT|nr:MULTISPECIES: hypothetical protein [Nitrosomonas]AKH36872.1 hypothetical protein AAW31_02150 [Nitrosomonas communis]TYP83909.1 hypothetical protein BCL69_104035 [Nitrosomonas communis]UVS61976.1 hypothetical protein NX761_02265 [Nitrosomonas sp. PLL12]
MNPTGICFISQIYTGSKTARVSVIEHTNGSLSVQISLTMKDSDESLELINLTANEAIDIGSNLEFLGNMIKVYEEDKH